jgi:hypothetical protein
MKRLIVVAVVGWLLVAARPVSGQRYWTEASTIGYGGLGVGAAIALCRSCDYAPFGTAVLAGAGLGLLTGYTIGRAAETPARRGEWPNGAQLLGARIGMVTGFAALGATVAALAISSPISIAPDELSLLVLSAAGAVVGVLLQARDERDLAARVGTRLQVGYHEELGLTVGMRVAP